MPVPFFPTLYPDELLYGGLARYHIWSQNISLKATVDDLLGSRSASAVIDLPNNLDKLCKQLSSETISHDDRRNGEQY